MARPLWSGALRFGLVNVPVRLYSAVSQKEVHFHLLHGKDGGRIRFQKRCALEDVPVENDDILKGYEVQRGQFITVTAEELEGLDPVASRSIDIEDFVAGADVDPVHFQAPYFLGPDQGADRTYALLTQVMRESGRVAVARMVMRTRQYLCLVRPYGPGLLLTTLNYADEVRDFAREVELPGNVPAPGVRELEMARQLVEALSAAWEPAKYRDTWREKVLAFLEQKAKGQPWVAAGEAPVATPEADLLQALSASLAAGRGGQRPAEAQRGELRHRAEAARRRGGRKPSARGSGKGR
jgi:DNA end-binding protein Ku